MKRVLGVLVVSGALGCGRLGYDATPRDAPLGDAPGVPTATTVETIGSTGVDRINAIAIDPAGNLYVGGNFEGTVDFGGGQRTSNGATDLFLASLTRSLAYRWDLTAGADGTDHTNRIHLSIAGDVYAMGLFESAVDLQGRMLTTTGSDNQFLVATTSGGVVRWAKSYGGSGDVIAVGGAVPDSGPGVVATGEYAGMQVLDTTTLTSVGAADLYVVGLEPDGTERWARSFGGPGAQRTLDVERAAAGLVLLGELAGSADFGGGVLTSRGGVDGFVLALDADGGHVWSRLIGGAGEDVMINVAVDPGGPIFVMGRFTGAIDLGAGLVSAVGAADAFLVALSPDGTPSWSRTWGSAQEDSCDGVAFGSGGEIYALGTFSGTIDFGGSILTSAGSEDIVLLVLSPAGGILRALRFGGPDEETAGDLVYDAATDELILTGEFRSTIDFGTGLVTSAGADDVFVVRMAIP